MPFRRWPSKTEPDDLFASPTPEHYLVAHVDGGARGNPGPAGYGASICDEEGAPVAQISEYLGKQTNNYAEYHGLLAALEFAVNHPANAVRVISDSELLVKQMKGVYKVSNPVLQELHARAKSLVRRLEWFTIQHVLRERNKDADALANEAMDRGTPGKVVRGAGEVAAKPKTARESEGVVRGGQVVLRTQLPEGAKVRVTVID